jgi:hypothetical protein
MPKFMKNPVVLVVIDFIGVCAMLAMLIEDLRELKTPVIWDVVDAPDASVTDVTGN